MIMDAATITVLVMTAVAVGGVVWLNIHSRKTEEEAREASEQSAKPAELAEPETRQRQAQKKSRR